MGFKIVSRYQRIKCVYFKTLKTRSHMMIGMTTGLQTDRHV